MMSFRGERWRQTSITGSTVWLLTDIAEAKGRQDLYTRQAPQILDALRELALIQSVESSNRIEGVTVEAKRLGPLVVGDARPRDRSEEEIRNYRRALQTIHARAAELSIDPDLLCDLHRTIQQGVSDAGRWKQRDNDIIELRPGTAPRVRFRPLPFRQTPAAADELCTAYRHVLDQRLLPPLLANAWFVFDFLCIHPFRDGNGRVSRLLTLLALYQQGYEVGRYISLERVIEDSREAYYEALRRSSVGWHEGRHDLLPWVNFFLTVLHRAYREFAERADQARTPRGGKTALIETAIANRLGEFTLADLERDCLGVSRDLIRRVLRRWRQTGRVVCRGRGPGARWRRKGTTL